MWCGRVCSEGLSIRVVNWIGEGRTLPVFRMFLGGAVGRARDALWGRFAGSAALSSLVALRHTMFVPFANIVGKPQGETVVFSNGFRGASTSGITRKRTASGPCEFRALRRGPQLYSRVLIDDDRLHNKYSSVRFCS